MAKGDSEVSKEGTVMVEESRGECSGRVACSRVGAGAGTTMTVHNGRRPILAIGRDDLYNLVYAPATLMVAFDRVAGNAELSFCGCGRLNRL